VHVLQHHEQRCRGSDLADQPSDRLEQLESPVVDRLGSGPVRQRAAELAALAGGPLADVVPRLLAVLDPALADDTELVAAVRSSAAGS